MLGQDGFGQELRAGFAMDDLGRMLLRESVEAVTQHWTAGRCLEESAGDGKVLCLVRLLEINLFGIEDERLETAIVCIDPPAADLMDQGVAEKVGKSRDTAGVETARLVKEHFVSGQEICRVFQDNTRRDANRRLINIKANADAILNKGREAEDFEIAETFPLPKGIYLHAGIGLRS